MNRELRGGWRKKTIGKKDLVVSTYKIRDEKLADNGIKFEILAKKGGIKVRDWVDKRKMDGNIEVSWKYIKAENKWKWDGENSFKVGRICQQLHRIGLYHMDLKPGNILWDKNGEIAAVIDFDECRDEKIWELEDTTNTLSWVLVSSGNDKRFIDGYKSGGTKIGENDIRKKLLKYLTMRQNEGSPTAWIELAKHRLEGYRQEVKSRQLKKNELIEYRANNKNKKIVLVVGAFELLHWGHLEFLKKAKMMGDLLIAGVASDSSRKRLKGESFPLIGEQTRAETLCFLGNIVDGVVIVDEDNVETELGLLKPEVVVTTIMDWEKGVRKVREEEIIKSYGGKIIKIKHLGPQVSSSKLVERVATMKVEQILFGGASKKSMLKVHRRLKINKEVKVENLEKLGNKLKKQKKKIVFTSLSADLFHVGHARFIQKAKSLGDVLVIGLPSNKSLRELKGPGRPIVDETARAWVLSELSFTDYVVVFDERTILKCLEELKPDVFFTVKEEWNQGLVDSPEAKLMQSIGGKIVRSDRMAPFISASKIIDRAAGELIKEKFAGVLKVAKEEPVINADFDPFSPQAQLTAREKGFYEKVWQTAEGMKCVFCDLKEKYIVTEIDGMVLTVALYPYTDGHLLIIPRRHIESMKELSMEEEKVVFELARIGTRLLRKKYGVENSWFLVREGNGIKVGKTVKHLHFHLIPYQPEVIKMTEVKLNILPETVAQSLREERKNG